MTKAITVSGLHKSFGETRALTGLDLDVEAGEVHGFLGPNGSGKSTTIRVLLGLLHADSGTARLLGRDPGPTPSHCTAGSPTSPATSRCGATSPEAKSSISTAGCAAASTQPGAPN